MIRTAKRLIPQRILIINPFGIGDVLFTTPLIRAVRRAFPESRLGYLCNRRTEHILRTSPQLDELYVYEKDELVQLWRTSPWDAFHQFSGLLRKIWHGGFDVVIDLSLGERYGFILKLLGVRRRVGFDYRRRGRFLTERMPIDGYHDVHVIEYYRKFLRFIGIRLVDASTELCVSAEDDRWARQWLREHQLDNIDQHLLVGMVPAGGVSWGVSAPFRRWSIDGFAAVGDALVKHYGATLILFGEPSDTSICKTVARLMKHPAIDLSGQTTLGQFVSLLAHLGLVICNDGGPLHLAVSQRVRTVSIFGPVDPNVYGPHPRSAEHQVVFREGLPCRPCYHQFKLPPCPYERACLTKIEPEEVLEACAALLSDRRAITAASSTHPL